ncbi:hypothetical protein FisN_20Hh032 [Fistulifera solaris]|uniref:SAP domain-containing protein n=1 Tax=Fistulifera solaris TaxID=1519565 RepID=A0A1Z5KC08_FISSO|nr:hypothetical protein FisN_20Hh032 [Fistulifera solaris]|eukprot:GAX23830.1 hypothetical protein FisN_20Hh032 [Fistulifera solaris]
MKFHFSLFLFLLQPTSAWIATSIVRSSFETTSHLLSESAVSSSSSSSTTATSSLTLDLVSKLRYRELREELSQRQLPHEGTTTQLRDRLRKAAIVECNLTETGELDENCQPTVTDELQGFVEFIDIADPEYEYKELVKDILLKAEQYHWKAATRKLKTLVRRFDATHDLPPAVFEATLAACMANRLQGARAAEPVRKILDEMAERGLKVSETAANYCIVNAIGNDDANSTTHQGFGGIDTALGMQAAFEIMQVPLQLETLEKITVALAKEGAVEEAMAQMKYMITERTETPPSLKCFANTAYAMVQQKVEGAASHMPTLLGYAKAAGYDLEQLSSLNEDGINLLGNAIVAADQMDNVALGLRLLTAAATTPGGDVAVATSHQHVRRAATRLHQRAISRAVQEEGQWKLAVKLLTLQLQRELRPNVVTWRTVVTCCAKARKSKRATALLLDWVQLYQNGKADKPPLTVFNTCMNACEICGEEELTLTVLDAMKNTHNTEGNLITFNIALKRLAKLGNHQACEGIIVGMLQEGIEPSVVSYTTAVAACAYREHRQPALALEWLSRMRSRRVNPNVLTYNTALSTCQDGTSEHLLLANEMAKQMLVDAKAQLATDGVVDEYTQVLPDATTRFLAKQLYQTAVAPELVESLSSLLQLSEFEVDEATVAARKAAISQEERQAVDLEVDLEFAATSAAHRVAEV